VSSVDTSVHVSPVPVVETADHDSPVTLSLIVAHVKTEGLETDNVVTFVSGINLRLATAVPIVAVSSIATVLIGTIDTAVAVPIDEVRALVVAKISTKGAPSPKDCVANG
jgi:hypothetical protein